MRVLRTAHPNPKYLPTSFLKARWKAWNPTGLKAYGRIAKPSSIHSRDGRSTPLTPTPRNTSVAASSPTAQPSSTQVNNRASTATDINHRSSVRSIMTLPPYHFAPLPNEQLIAREGERAGVDTVIEFPETEEELEEHREEEMATLYNIREARRREQREREERRQARREAREQHDWSRLEQIEREARVARARAQSNASAASSSTNLQQTNSNTSDVSFLIAELASQREARRNHRVSSVSYADLGLARHDGSRIRADSIENDSAPLLSSAASMGESTRGSRNNSPYRAEGHRRDISNTSIASAVSSTTINVDTPAASSTDMPANHLTPQVSAESYQSNDSYHDTPPPDFEPPSYESDISTQPIPTIPEEDAPPYSSPTVERGDRTSGLWFPRSMEVAAMNRRNVTPPVIEIRSATPVNSVPPTPTVPENRRPG